MDLYQQFIYKRTYSRWLESEGRREHWEETVQRYFDFFRKHLVSSGKYTSEEFSEKESWIKPLVLNLHVMPSMRALWTAGPALEESNVAGYNCSYISVDSLRAFDEAMYILMCGTGLGFSVESQFVSKLPEIAETFYQTETTIVVKDSKIGWAKAYKELLTLLASGQIPTIDYSHIRPEGSRLKTFGGRASGPKPLQELFAFAIKIFKSRAGKSLRSIDCHDLMCKTAEVVVVGGVRRSALISLSDPDDYLMQRAKAGSWWDENPQRSLSNNSLNYQNYPSIGEFMAEWLSLYESKSGERGIFSTKAAQDHIDRNNHRYPSKRARDPKLQYGCNPCSEILLQSNQFCNLTEIVLRPSMSNHDFLNCARAAAVLGVWQATLTDFKYLRKVWKSTTESERLLGVSLTGIADLGSQIIPYREMRQAVHEAANTETDKLGIERSTSMTAIKPSGSVSQLVNSSSGIHERFAPFYIRRVRVAKSDPITPFLKSKGVPCEDDVMNSKTAIFSFPQKAPEGALCVGARSAVAQFRHWMHVMEAWADHKVSCTIYVKEHEWLELGAEVFKHLDKCSGVSFLPYSDHTYQQAPYEAISEARYADLTTQIPLEIDWSELSSFEQDDNTTGAQNLACTGDKCELL